MVLHIAVVRVAPLLVAIERCAPVRKSSETTGDSSLPADLVEYDELQWPLSRAPLLLETSVPGIFAVGDARSGSVKRVASAVGEGAMAVHLVHRFLAESTERQKTLSH